MYSSNVHGSRATFILRLLGACMCGAMTIANAAPPYGSRDLRLQLDWSLNAASGDEDPGLFEECVEEGDAVPVVTAAVEENKARPAARPLPVALNAASLVKPVPAVPRPQEPAESLPAPIASRTTPAPAIETVAAVAPPQPVPSQPAAAWEIVPTDKTLNTAMARWAEAAGWQLLWELPVDYAVETRSTVSGTFEQAVEAVAKSMDAANIPMQAIFYNGNKVLRIVAKGSE